MIIPLKPKETTMEQVIRKLSQMRGIIITKKKMDELCRRFKNDDLVEK